VQRSRSRSREVFVYTKLHEKLQIYTQSIELSLLNPYLNLLFQAAVGQLAMTLGTSSVE
jgi:hypothetical protein